MAQSYWNDLAVGGLRDGDDENTMIKFEPFEFDVVE